MLLIKYLDGYEWLIEGITEYEKDNFLFQLEEFDEIILKKGKVNYLIHVNEIDTIQFIQGSEGIEKEKVEQ